ncbi:hypothetical protein ABRZ87_07470 [Vibrio vulnificus]|uniref:lipopolysaccharide biosynthesis protein n=1 Tax=Vibrio vulnificus TaxID=672 RepID=UPI001A33B105|nr:hypothetical protein [Vibrio vulnificus]ELK8508823.1 hypothetical protein [Vibrio vulnificus]ELK8995301.1 hypothetical protein [Vibrio vulnificus]HAS6089099.1 hypothetical protein [Vibrio vulnificus]HDY7838868.1 hypothetical protein [Vibrio vulnificus]
MFKKFLYFFSVNIVVKFLSFGTLLAVATILTPQELGSLKTIQSISEVITTISILGLNTAFLRFYPLSLNKEKVKIETTYFYTILFASVVLTLISVFLFENNRLYLLLIPSTALVSIYIYIYQLQEKYKELALNQAIIKILSFFAVIISTKFYGLNGFIISNVALSYLGLFYLFIKNKINLRIKHVRSDCVKKAYPVAKYAFISTIINVVTVNIGIYILNITDVDDEKLGIYSLSVILLIVFQIFRSVIQQFISPILTRESKNKNGFILKVNSLQKIVYFSFTLIALISGAIFCILYKDTPKLLINYKDSFKYIIFMIGPWLISSYYVIKVVAFNSIGLTKVNLIKDLIIFPITIIVSYLLALYYSISGLILSQYVITVITCLVVRVMFKRNINSHSYN